MTVYLPLLIAIIGLVMFLINSKTPGKRKAAIVEWNRHNIYTPINPKTGMYAKSKCLACGMFDGEHESTCKKHPSAKEIQYAQDEPSIGEMRREAIGEMRKTPVGENIIGSLVGLCNVAQGTIRSLEYVIVFTGNQIGGEPCYSKAETIKGAINNLSGRLHHLRELADKLECIIGSRVKE